MRLITFATDNQFTLETYFEIPTIMKSIEETLNNKIGEITDSITPIKEKIPFDYETVKSNNQICDFLKIGNLIGKSNNVYPALVNLVNENAIAFKLNDSNRDEIHLAIQNYVLQILERSKRGSVELSVVDIEKMGANFRLLRRLDNTLLKDFVADKDGFKEFLGKQHDKSVSVITECLTNYENLADYNNQSGHVVPFRIIILADFPNLYSNFEKFETILKNAKEAGIFVFMTCSQDVSSLSRSDQTAFGKVLNHFLLLEEYGNPVNDFYRIVLH